MELQLPHAIRVPKSKLLAEGELERTVVLASRSVGPRGGVIVLIDSDLDCPAQLGPTLSARARAVRGDVKIGVVIAKHEFEAWFLASASSLNGMRGLPADLVDVPDPEDVRSPKSWLDALMPPGRKYSETVDQAALAASFDMVQARRRSDSFDKLWREIEKLIV
jgi:hypothetical protein